MSKLTQDILELLQYVIELQKNYANEKVDEKVDEVIADLGQTKDELKALVNALDALDFKEDGEIDVATLTKAVADTKAALELNANDLDALKGTIADMTANISNIAETLGGLDEIDALKNDISGIKNIIDNFTGDDDIADLKERVSTIETKVEDLSLDVEAIKAQLSLSVSAETSESTETSETGTTPTSF